jgi:ribonucleoside-diphosphate reductase alpha chain
MSLQETITAARPAVNGQATVAMPQPATAPSQGLAFEWTFADPNCHPFDQVEWRELDAEIKDEAGKLIFRQRVHVPASWSDTAAQVVASKYYWGDAARGDDPRQGGREHSAAQLIGRVCGTIGRWGREDGYFATPIDAHRFETELAWLCLNQYAAFNSPVWFNVGLHDAYGITGRSSNWRWERTAGAAVPADDYYKYPQGSACQPYGALVNTTQGLLPIGEIVEREMVGLSVYDGHGSTTKVVAVMSNGRKPVYRILLNDGFSVEATDDHRVCAHTARRTVRPEWVKVADLKPGMLMRVHPGGESVRDHPGVDDRAVFEAALAGWLQTDGFVGRYEEGTNRSLTIEFETVNEEELVWVMKHVRVVFPGVHHHLSKSEVADPGLDYTRVRLYGEVLKDFVARYGLMTRNPHQRVPTSIERGTDEVVIAYLRSVFQADGFVCLKTLAGSDEPNTAVVAVAKCSSEMMRGIQRLLARLGIYARLVHKEEKRSDRHDQWEVRIAIASEREKFASLVGFIASDKQSKLQQSIDLEGKDCPPVRYQTIVAIEPIGEADVYDIQTESGNYLTNFVLVHNCFIQSVTDDMEGIMDLAKSEAILFKYGSGTGTDLSPLRSTREKLSGGGKPSGPVSFMRIYDAGAGVVKSGGRSRRAAKMQVLRCDHPDIMEFVECKPKEDRKARALIAAGYSAGMTGHPDEAYSSVFFQNSNLSVGVTDAFMERATAADPDFRRWSTIAVTTGDPVETLDAGTILDAIAQGTWECGDPGIECLDIINQWHTCSNTAPIRCCNPCSEYLFICDSACNLASLNLMKFRRPDGTFDDVRFRAACRILITAQEILVDRASYPTQKIAENSHKFRPLGLGYSNLGALIMASGLPYDSHGGRDLAAAVTGLMTAQAYRTSAEIAAFKGPFEGFAVNRESMLRVMDKHGHAAHRVLNAADHPEAARLARIADGAWKECIRAGQEHGYRNAQSTLTAPTGTISFMMDCDTTGLEPAIALVCYKSLAGGGVLKLVNRVVPDALETLGYSTEKSLRNRPDGTGAPFSWLASDIDEIVAYLHHHDTIEGAPHLKPEHLAVFDCAFPARPGGRTIHWRGHVKMVAAIQPLISGASSKTICMPESSTVEDIKAAYVEGWKLGVKAMAIYRDNSKGAQPVSTKDPTVKVEMKMAAPSDTVVSVTLPPSVIINGAESEAMTVAAVPDRPRRERLPATRQSVTHRFVIGGHHEGYATVGLYPDGRPGELFLKVSKEGSTISGLLDSIAILTSLCLQYGVPPDVLERKFRQTRFEPSGPTDNSKLPWATSIPDYIFRWLAGEFRPDTPVAVVDSPSAVLAALGQVVERVVAAELPPPSPIITGPPCPDCGALLERKGSCYVCGNCFYTGGCG